MGRNPPASILEMAADLLPLLRVLDLLHKAHTGPRLRTLSLNAQCLQPNFQQFQDHILRLDLVNHRRVQ